VSMTERTPACSDRSRDGVASPGSGVMDPA
jgi:hypothetical protein